MSESEPEYELGDLLFDDHDERMYRVVHRMQNYDDPTDFLYALELPDESIPGYSWWGEEWIEGHYELIEVEQVEEDEIAEVVAEACGMDVEDVEVNEKEIESVEMGEPERVEEDVEE